MKSLAKTALITGLPFGISMGVLAGVAFGITRRLSNGVVFGLVVAIASGLVFGLAMASFMAIQRRRFAQARPDFASEQLLHDGPANHFFNGEGVGGWLFLTRERLLFRSHKYNFQRHELSIPLEEIAEIRPVRTAIILPNGLRIITRSGRDDRFLVEARRKWCSEIVKAQAEMPAGTGDGAVHLERDPSSEPRPPLTRSTRLRRLEPESQFIVRLSDSEMVCERPDGKVERVAWADLRKVEVVTTGDGPFDPDVFWVLHGTESGCAVPQGATGDRELLERLQDLPGFDNGAVIEAMSCTSDKRFLCWERAG
jgi:hypothetical protein